jgi:hypothetical protein
MDKEFKETNQKYFWYPLIMLIVGILLGVFMPSSKSSKTKQYPIEVRCSWSTYGFQSYPTMDADSVKGDTIYKDELSIVNKNIVNINFK